MTWFAQAPANIALIKYMGKENEQTNSPANPSLSYTLPHLLSHVTLDQHEGPCDVWEPLEAPGLLNQPFSDAAQARFLKHLAFLKEQFHYTGFFKVRSGNNFPHGTGLASSASSFAALTRCATDACAALTQTTPPSVDRQAQLSRQGSGSSCRSFFEPWALWETETAVAIDLPYPHLHHQVILIHPGEKKVSSSQAHQRIKTSPHYTLRPQRARGNLNALLQALHTQQWEEAYLICWREFQDMHALFHHAEPSFTYMTDQTNNALARIQQRWIQTGDGPLVTMDAGPNIHLLYRPDQTELALQFKRDFVSDYDVL